MPVPAVVVAVPFDGDVVVDVDVWPVVPPVVVAGPEVGGDDESGAVVSGDAATPAMGEADVVRTAGLLEQAASRTAHSAGANSRLIATKYVGQRSIGSFRPARPAPVSC